jgi:hypothetical protein
MHGELTSQPAQYRLQWSLTELQTAYTAAHTRKAAVQCGMKSQHAETQGPALALPDMHA